MNGERKKLFFPAELKMHEYGKLQNYKMCE
jgi:hypothetical protein